MQMVSVLALNKLELKEMINTEIVENPVLEELEENVPLLDDVAGKEAERERAAEEIVADAQRDKADPFEEIDFGSYFQEYLDPGFRSPNNYELTEKPSFENFLSQAEHPQRSSLLAARFVEPGPGGARGGGIYHREHR